MYWKLYITSVESSSVTKWLTKRLTNEEMQPTNFQLLPKIAKSQDFSQCTQSLKIIWFFDKKNRSQSFMGKSQTVIVEIKTFQISLDKMPSSYVIKCFYFTWQIFWCTKNSKLLFRSKFFVGWKKANFWLATAISAILGNFLDKFRTYVFRNTSCWLLLNILRRAFVTLDVFRGCSDSYFLTIRYLDDAFILKKSQKLRKSTKYMSGRLQ